MWSEEGNCLVKEFKFADFAAALAFVDQIGSLAEAANHHPEIELGWGRVKVSLTTHSAGHVTDKDKLLSREIDALETS